MGFSGRGSRNRIRRRRPPSCYRERQWHGVHFAAGECGAIEKAVKPSTQIADARVNVSQHGTAIAAATDSIHIGTTTARSTFCSECPGHASCQARRLLKRKSGTNWKGSPRGIPLDRGSDIVDTSHRPDARRTAGPTQSALAAGQDDPGTLTPELLLGRVRLLTILPIIRFHTRATRRYGASNRSGRSARG